MKITLTDLFCACASIMRRIPVVCTEKLIDKVIDCSVDAWISGSKEEEKQFDDIRSDINSELLLAEEYYSDVINPDDPRKELYQSHSGLLKTLASRLIGFAGVKRRKMIKGVLLKSIIKASSLLKILANNLVSFMWLNYAILKEKSEQNIKCAREIREALKIAVI